MRNNWTYVKCHNDLYLDYWFIEKYKIGIARFRNGNFQWYSGVMSNFYRDNISLFSDIKIKNRETNNSLKAIVKSVHQIIKIIDRLSKLQSFT